MRDWIGYVLEWGGVRLGDLSTTQVSILNLVVLSSFKQEFMGLKVDT